MKMKPLADLIGDAEPLMPAEMQYRAVLALVWVARNSEHPEQACRGCIFKGQRAKVCVQAGEIARRVGLPDCEARDVESDKTHIYVITPTDPRQLSIDDCAS